LTYTLTATDSGPTIAISRNPAVTEYQENTLLATTEDALPLPRGIIETCVPRDITNWSETETGIKADFPLLRPSDISGDPLSRDSQQITVHENSAEVSLPRSPELADTPVCTRQFVYGSDGFELAVTLSPPEQATHAIAEPTAIPSVSLPRSVALALDYDQIPVTVYESGPGVPRSQLQQLYGADTPPTTPEDWDSTSTGNIPIPERLETRLRDDQFTTGSIRLVPDAETLLVVFDSNTPADPAPGFELADGAIKIDDTVAEWLAVDSCEIYWHTYDGTLTGELLNDGQPLTLDTDGFTGTVDDRTTCLPPTAVSQTGINFNDDNVGIVATASRDQVGVSYVQDAGCTIQTEPRSDTTCLKMPAEVPHLLDITADDAVLCYPRTDRVTCLPMDASLVSQHAVDTNAQEAGETQLDVPKDGENAFVHPAGNGDPAVDLPARAITQFGLTTDDIVAIRVGTYNGTLALRCDPVVSTTTQSVCVGRMLSSSKMRLPLALVSTLSLFDRTITWGLQWNSQTPQLIGLLEEFPTAPLKHGTDVGIGHVSTSTPADSSATDATQGYTVTLPASALAVYKGTPPGMLVSCENIDGRPRLALTPVAESDLDISGTVRVQDNANHNGWQITLPKALATALGVPDTSDVSWTLVEGRLIGTLSSTNRF
jgi:antitoxin component of MazEF toxin-antitoxin module